MKIDAVQNINFTSHPLAETKKAMITRIRTNSIAKPIKNYAQYIKEYGLDKTKVGKK